MKWALSIPLLDNQIYGQIRKKLIDALGGRFKEIIIGGAAMNPEVEEFFHKIKFPLHHWLRHDGMRSAYQLCSLGQIRPLFIGQNTRYYGSPHL